jgi:hypothetical protein
LISVRDLHTSNEDARQSGNLSGVVRAIGYDCNGVTIRLGYGVDYGGVGRAIEMRMDVTLPHDADVELLARQRVIARANYRFGVSDNGLWPVDLEVVERAGVTYLRIMHALDDHYETEFRTRRELEALLRANEDAGEIGYLRARAHLLAQYEAIQK